jgi:hypothetical protein
VRRGLLWRGESSFPTKQSARRERARVYTHGVLKHHMPRLSSRKLVCSRYVERSPSPPAPLLISRQGQPLLVAVNLPRQHSPYYYNTDPQESPSRAS